MAKGLKNKSKLKKALGLLVAPLGAPIKVVTFIARGIVDRKILPTAAIKDYRYASKKVSAAYQDLMQANSDANGAIYAKQFRTQVISQDPKHQFYLVDFDTLANAFTPLPPDATAEQKAALQSFKYSVKTDLQQFGNELNHKIHSGVSLEEIHYLKSQYVKELQQKLLELQNALNPALMFNDTALKSAYQELYQDISQNLTVNINNAYTVHDNWQLWAQDSTLKFFKEGVEVDHNDPSVALLKKKLEELKQSYANDLKNILTNLSKDADLIVEIKDLQTKTQAKLTELLSELQYQGISVQVETNKDSDKVLKSLQQRFIELTDSAIALRQQMNEAYSVPKSMLQQWRQEYDQRQDYAKWAAEKQQIYQKAIDETVTAVENLKPEIPASFNSTGSATAAPDPLATQKHALYAFNEKYQIDGTFDTVELNNIITALNEITETVANKDELTEAKDLAYKLQAAPLAKTYRETAEYLKTLQQDYLTKVQQALEIEQLYAAEDAKTSPRLQALKTQYDQQVQDALTILQDAKDKADLKPELASVFDKQIEALSKASKDDSVFTEAKTKREAADKAYQEFQEKYHWYLLKRGMVEDRHFKLDDKTRHEIANTQPQNELKSLKENELLHLGPIAVRKAKGGGYEMCLGEEGVTNTAWYWWWGAKKRKEEAKRILQDPDKLDILGSALEQIAKANGNNSISVTAKSFSDDTYDTMLAIYVAAQAKGIHFDIDADIDKSFNETRYQGALSRVFRYKSGQLNQKEKDALKARFKKDLAKYQNRSDQSLAINDMCRQVGPAGAKAGKPDETALKKHHAQVDLASDAEVAKLWQGLTAISHLETQAQVEYTKLTTTITPPRTTSHTETEAIGELIQRANDINLLSIKAIMPDGGDQHKRAAAYTGVVLERQHFTAALQWKARELASLTRLENNDPMSAALSAAYAQLHAEIDHFNQLAAKAGCKTLDQKAIHNWADTIDKAQQVNNLEAAISQILAKNVKEIAGFANFRSADPEKRLNYSKEIAQLQQLEFYYAHVPTALVDRSPLAALVTAHELSDLDRFIEVDFTARLKNYEDALIVEKERLTKEQTQLAKP